MQDLRTGRGPSMLVYRYHVTPSLFDSHMALDGLIILDKAGFVSPPRVIITRH